MRHPRPPGGGGRVDGGWDLGGMTSCALLIGNSRWHWAHRHDGRWCFQHAAPDPMRIDTSKLIWAAVGEVPAALEEAQDSRLLLDDVPLEGCPPWLGVDRALGAWGAWRRQRSNGYDLDQGLLLADAGTVLSLTLIDAHGCFRGGRLMPGLRLQLQAMASGTALLPAVTGQQRFDDPFPKGTAEAMGQGVMQGLAAAVVDAQQRSGACLWLCGGDAPWLQEELIRRGLSVQMDQQLQLLIHLN